MNYRDKLKDPRWQKKRLEVMQRDKFACRECGRTDKTLQVHHCSYRKRNPDLSFTTVKAEPWDVFSGHLLTLCDECHEERHKLEASCRDSIEHLFSVMNRDQLRELRLKLDFDLLPKRKS